jgi:hypothetical protein
VNETPGLLDAGWVIVVLVPGGLAGACIAALVIGGPRLVRAMVGDWVRAGRRALRRWAWLDRRRGRGV